jgi:phosphatidylinositol alpha-mannosyltransferase
MPPKVPYIRSVSTGGRIFQRAVSDADEVVALSEYMQTFLHRRFGRGGVKIPVPVDTDRFRLNRQRDHVRPIIFCAGALDDARKGGQLLMRAFDQLKESRPTAVLQLSCRLGETARANLMGHVSPKRKRDVEFLGAGELDDLPELYGRAAVSVLPSLWEGFGMVVLESMAAGTPVVGTCDGAIPELIPTPNVGRLFDPGVDPANAAEPTNVEGLTRSLLEALDLSSQPETALACRAHAEKYSWSNIGPRFEEIYERMTQRVPAPSTAPGDGHVCSRPQ